MFVAACIAAFLAIAALVVAISLRNKEAGYDSSIKPATPVKIVAAVLAAVAAVFMAASFVYTQGIGEAKVLKAWTGEVIGQDSTPGMGYKSPFTKIVDFDIRNQSAAYKGDGKDATGPQITVTDKDGVRSDVDVTVLYSINPDAVSDIYREHQNQETFKARVVEQDIRSVVRTVPGKFGTQTLLNDRTGVESAISEALTARWADQGIVLESVALQEVRPPGEVLARYADAQAAQAQVAKETALLDAAKVKAQQKVVEATAEAEANNLLTKSLTKEVLEQRYLDTLKSIGEKGNLVVVPDGSTPMVQVQK